VTESEIQKVVVNFGVRNLCLGWPLLFFASSFKKPSCAAQRRAGVCIGGVDIKRKEAESQSIHNFIAHVRKSCV